MLGKTSKQRLTRLAELVNKPAAPDKPLIPWMKATDENITRLASEIYISELPGHGARKVIEEKINGVKTGRITLAKKMKGEKA